MGQNCSKKGTSSLKQKSGYHHCIQHIQVNLGNKCHLKQTILANLTKFAKKGWKNVHMGNSVWVGYWNIGVSIAVDNQNL